MMLTSLLALAISLPSTNPVSMTGNAVSISLGNTLPTTDYYCYTGSFSFSNDVVGSIRFDVNYDNNYNEYFLLSYDVNFTDHYYRFYCEHWFNNFYNVTGFANFYLTRRNGLTQLPVGSWTSNNGFLGSGDFDLPIAFGGDSDVNNFNFSTSTIYYLDIYVYLALVPNYDYSSSSQYMDGYNNGYTDGQNSGYQNGYQDGVTEGQQTGYTNGFNDGKTQGYNEGYNTALSTHDFNFNNLFYAIGDTPILMIRRLFGFELFGVSLISVFMTLFTALIVIHLIKKVF